MVDMVKDLTKEIKNQLSILISEKEGNEDVIAWINKEYSRFMMVSSDNYIDCLNCFIKENPNNIFNEVYEMLLTHLGKYGSTQAIFRASSELIKQK